MSINPAAAAIRPSNYYVEEDVVVEILLRLPVKTLVQFKCVCKRWNDIIASQSFVKEHYGHASNKECLLIVRGNFTTALVVDDAFEEPDHLQFPYNSLWRVIGAVNGILCLVGESNEIALLNPATRQLKPLPRLLVDEPHSRFRYYEFGFGIDPLTGHYKVVVIGDFWHISAVAKDLDPLVFVYNSGSNSWSNVAAFKSSGTPYSGICNQFVNGIYYWTLSTYVNTTGVLAFDMSTDKFEEIQVPDCVKQNVWLLAVRGDSLAMVPQICDANETFELWVMENKGMWNKVAVVGPFPEVSLLYCFWRDNELVLYFRGIVLNLYNIITKETRVHDAAQFYQYGNSMLTCVLNYKESLVSIKGEGDDCLVWDAFSDVLLIAWAKQH